MADHEPFLSQRAPEWTLMLDPKTDEIHAIRCRFAAYKREWIFVASETDLIPWPVSAMNMNLLSNPRRIEDEDDSA